MAAVSADALRNELAGHPSPYLALHADDPVQWQRWNEDAFAQAARAGQLLLVSSGYFSCHWCHVMQRESFRDARIAAVINRHFVPVKVDREAAPALDAALLDFARRTRGSAGWPLQVFVTPDGYPLVAATYQPPQEFVALLKDVAARWQRDAGPLRATARAAAQQVQDDVPSAAPPRPGRFASRLREAAMQRADDLQGGFGTQSRFSHLPQLLALLDLQAREPERALGDFLRLTLRQMATQGLHDELNGGFFRYTVDPDWQTPHFEKLLVDNALLARVYLRAAKVLDEPAWRAVATQTLDFILRDLAAPGGGYFIALSAVDADGVDGGRYLWSRDELRRRAGAHWPLLARYWGLDGLAPFAAGHLPIPQLSRAQLAAEFQRTPASVDNVLDNLYAQLRRARAQQVQPADRQLIAAANALLLTALAEAAAAVEDGRAQARYAAAAQTLAQLLRDRFVVDGRLRRALDTAATLEDYAYVTQALLSWSGQRKTLDAERPLLNALLQQAWTRYHDNGHWRLGEDALLRWGGTRLALADTAQPAPPAVLLQVAETLEWQPERTAAAVRAAWPAVDADPFRHASWLRLYR